MTNGTRFLAALVAMGAFAGATHAQTIQTIVESGTLIPGVGNMTNVRGVAVDNAGHVLVHVYTDNPNLALNAAIVDEHGTVRAADGQSLAQPPGRVIADFGDGAIMLSGTGDPTYLIDLTPNNGFDDIGLYHGLPPVLFVQNSWISTAPQLRPGSIYSLMLPPRINSMNQVAFHGTVDDPTIIGLYDTEVLMRFDLVTGAQNVVHKENDILPGQTQGISSFDWNYMDINDLGQVFFGCGTNAAAGHNRVLYIDNTKVAQTSDPTPFGGTYIGVGGSGLPLSLNDFGDYAFMCRLSDIELDKGIVFSGQPFVQEGDTFPAIEPFKLTDMDQPLCLGSNGRLLWYGFWDAINEHKNGLFVDYSLLIEVGVTRIHGQRVTQLQGFGINACLSRNGRYAIFEATLESGTVGAYLVDLGP